MSDVDARLSYLDGGSPDTNTKGSHKIRLQKLE